MPDTKLYIGSTAASFKIGAADCSIYLGDVKMYPVEEPVVHIPLTFEILDDNFSFKNAQSFSFKVNGGSTTTVASNTYTTAPINSGDTVEVYANASTASRQFTTNGRFKVKGNPISFSYGTTWQSHSGDTIASACTNMFMNCTGLTDASEIELPSSIGMYSCYCMFSGCTNLTAAPELPATTLRSNCYRGMFQGCTSLTTAPTLPATTLADSCYRAMFAGCSGITAAPALSANIAGSYGNCYSFMFQDCTSLTSAPALPATSLADNCYEGMFAGCTSLTTAPELSASTVPSAGYRRMFSGCTSLATAPVIHASSVQASGCNQMFQSCSSLTTPPVLSATTLAANAYNQMFDSCTSLTTAPDLPATTINGLTYSSMFQNCTSLVNAPSISATTFGASGTNNQHMRKMFAGCTSLTAAPSLPATSLQQRCYEGMFSGCTSLTTAPELQATNIPASAYTSMFEGCTSLVESPVLPATTVGTNGYTKMFSGCTSMNKITCLYSSSTAPTFTNWVAGVAATGVFYKAAGMNDWTTGVNGIPTNWTVMNYIDPSSCYDVTSDIQSYTSTTYLDVYDSTAEKWYKLNNLNQYEEYGVYGEGKDITYYVGKHTFDNWHEWTWNGSEWVDDGVVVTGGSLPNVAFSVNYNAKNFVPATSSLTKEPGQLADTDVVISGAPFTYDTDHITITGNCKGRITGFQNYFNRTSGSGNSQLTIVTKALTRDNGNLCSLFTNRNSGTDYNWMYRQYNDKLAFHGSSNLSGVSCSSSEPNILLVRVNANGGVYFKNCTTNQSTYKTGFKYGKTNNAGATLFNGYYTDALSEEWHGDFYWVYMTQNFLDTDQIQQVIDYNDGNILVYPVEYSAKTAPVTSVTFTSTTEMYAYECPYEGLFGIIGNDWYLYSSTNGWVLQPPTNLPYLALIAKDDDFYFQFSNDLQYSTNQGRTWINLPMYETSPYFASGTTILLKSTNTPNEWEGIGRLGTGGGAFDVSGNPLSLSYGDNFTGGTIRDYEFVGLFNFNNSLENASGMTLSSTTLGIDCYRLMFESCGSLVSAPTLPATTLVSGCYNQMFAYCYSLSAITCLATDISATNCTNNWVYGVSETGTFVKNPSMSSWTTGTSGIPSGWTVVDNS